MNLGSLKKLAEVGGSVGASFLPLSNTGKDALEKIADMLDSDDPKDTDHVVSGMFAHQMTQDEKIRELQAALGLGEADMTLQEFIRDVQVYIGMPDEACTGILDQPTIDAWREHIARQDAAPEVPEFIETATPFVPKDVFDFFMDLEGGYALHENENDTGGQTYAGISRRWWPDLWIWKDLSRLTRDPDDEIKLAVRAFYDEQFWTKIWLEKVDDTNKAAAIFIFGVNAGTGVAIRRAQMTCFPTAPAEWDGAVGDQTIAGINDMPRNEFLSLYFQMCEARYNEVVEENPKQATFRKGWQTRISRVDQKYNDGLMSERYVLAEV